MMPPLNYDPATVDAFDRMMAEEAVGGAAYENGRRSHDWVREPPEESDSSEPPPYRADESAADEFPRGSETVALRFRTAKELIQTVPEVVPWVARPWVSAGTITEITGKIKNAGKTTFTAAMVRAVVTGSEFIGESTTQGKVVYLTEQPDTSFSVALRQAGLADSDDVLILSWKDTRRTNWPLVVALAAEKAKAERAVMLVVDTLPQFAGLTGDAENNAGAALGAMEPLQAVAADGLAVVVVRHDRKSGGDVGDSGRGSSAFGGAVDVVLSIRRVDGKRPNARVIHALSRFPETPETAVVELRRADSSAPDEPTEGPDEYVLVGEETAIIAEITAAAVLEHLPAGEDEAITGTELAAAIGATGGKRTTLYEVLGHLHDQGQLGRNGAGKKGDPFRWWIRPENSSAYKGGGSDESNLQGRDLTDTEARQ